MSNNSNGPQAGGLALADIYYTLFRHKWMILSFAVAGLVTAFVIFLTKPPLYLSEAKFLIRYVLETKALHAAGTDPQIKFPGSQGENIINCELEILTSADLALQVAEAIGPERILAKVGGGNDQNRAAGLILKNLAVDVPRKSNIIKVTLAHPDPEIPQAVLRQLIESYLQKHVAVHRAVGMHDDFLSKQTDQLRSQLAQTEEELRKLKSKVGVFSLEDSKMAFIAEITKIRQELFSAEAELAEHQAALKGLELTPSKADGLDSAEQRDRINAYKNVTAQLEALRNKETLLLGQLTDEHPLVVSVHKQITEAEKQKKKLEAENPNLVMLSATSPYSQQQNFDPLAETKRVTALQARINSLTSRMDKIRLEAVGLEEAAPAIKQLERKKEVEETNYRYYSSALEQARVEEALGPGKVSNVSIVQVPSVPGRDMSGVLKPTAVALAVGLLGGIALAFLIELILDQTLKRPTEVETRLQLPLFLSIPAMISNGHSRFSLRKNKPTQPAGGPMPEASQNGLALRGPDQRLRPFHEALRDRLIMDFQIKNMTHKPKLVAVTSCSKGAGVTTIASGLAAALSETGDGNVLLVDMNLEQGAAHPYHEGMPACSLSDALEQEKRSTALVQENLYVALARGAKDNRSSLLPKQLTNIVPKLKASDYDYIIFDMPPISQTSVTPKLAGLMDTVLLVVESEKSHRDLAQRAKRMLTEADANVAVVFNKHRNYVPARLQPELY